MTATDVSGLGLYVQGLLGLALLLVGVACRWS